MDQIGQKQALNGPETDLVRDQGASICNMGLKSSKKGQEDILINNKIAKSVQKT